MAPVDVLWIRIVAVCIRCIGPFLCSRRNSLSIKRALCSIVVVTDNTKNSSLNVSRLKFRHGQISEEETNKRRINGIIETKCGGRCAWFQFVNSRYTTGARQVLVKQSWNKVDNSQRGFSSRPRNLRPLNLMGHERCEIAETRGYTRRFIRGAIRRRVSKLWLQSKCSWCVYVIVIKRPLISFEIS